MYPKMPDFIKEFQAKTDKLPKTSDNKSKLDGGA